MDIEEGNIAKGTAKAGYQNRKKAKEVAKGLRDVYGAWATVPF